MESTISLNLEQLKIVFRALEKLADTTANLEIEKQARALNDEILLQSLGVSKND